MLISWAFIDFKYGLWMLFLLSKLYASSYLFVSYSSQQIAVLVGFSSFQIFSKLRTNWQLISSHPQLHRYQQIAFLLGVLISPDWNCCSFKINTNNHYCSHFCSPNYRLKYLVEKIHPAVAAYDAVLFSIVLINFLLATFVDPGVFPRSKYTKYFLIPMAHWLCGCKRVVSSNSAFCDDM